MNFITSIDRLEYQLDISFDHSFAKPDLSVISSMGSKRKKNICSEGPVKIVGINHGACIHHFLLMDGWKKEQFTVKIKTILLWYHFL